MARKKKTAEYTAEDRLKFDLEDKMRRINFIPEPTYFYNIGDEVFLGNLRNIRVVEVLEGGKIYKVEYSIEKKEKEWTNTGYNEKITLEGGHFRYVFWLDIRPLPQTTESLIVNDNINLNFTQRALSSLFSNFYYFGTDMNPEYQRDYCWEMEDKVALIESIFSNVDIGKFVFVHNNYDDEYLYEILDGKQRLRAILDFYENRFPYKGKYFNDLSIRDQNWFENKCIAVAEVSKTEKKNLLKYFLMLNTTGKSMDKSHIDNVRKMLEECE